MDRLDRPKPVVKLIDRQPKLRQCEGRTRKRKRCKAMVKDYKYCIRHDDREEEDKLPKKKKEYRC